MSAWVPAHLTDAQKADATEYEPGDLLQFHQNAPGYKKGSRLIVGEGAEAADGAGQAVRGLPADAVCPGGRGPRPGHGRRQDQGREASSQQRRTADRPGIHQRRGDIIVDHGWVIDRDFGHITHGYCVTSHASQGVTVDKVFIGMSSESLPGDQRAHGLCGTDTRQGAGGDFHGRQGRAAEGGQPPGRSDVGDGTFGVHAKRTGLGERADEAAGVRSRLCHVGPAAWLNAAREKTR